MASPSPDALGLGDASSAQPQDAGSFVPVIVVLAIIASLTAASVAVGQLLVGPRGLRRTGYDMEAFVVRMCGVCAGSVEEEAVQVVVSPAKETEEDEEKKKEPCSGDGASEVEEPSEALKNDAEESGTLQAYARLVGIK